MKKMKYGSFTFPHNPRESSYSYDRSYAIHKYPEYKDVDIEDFGPNVITITCSGEFFGKNAYKTWGKLRTEFRKKNVQKFTHPIHSSIKYGLITKLNGGVEPRKDYISYSFDIVVGDEIDEDPIELSKGISGPSGSGSGTYGGSSHSSSSSNKRKKTSNSDDDEDDNDPLSKFDVGDAVYITGKMYVSSSGPNYITTFTKHKTTITKIDKDADHPIHIGGAKVGWVDISSVTMYRSSSKSSDGGTITYTVKSGETLSQICARYGISDWKSVAEYNGIKDARKIRVGQKIKIKK